MYSVAKNGRECVCSGKRVLCRDSEQGLTEDERKRFKEVKGVFSAKLPVGRADRRQRRSEVVQPDLQIRAAGFSGVPVRCGSRANTIG